MRTPNRVGSRDLRANAYARTLEAVISRAEVEYWAELETLMRRFEDVRTDALGDDFRRVARGLRDRLNQLLASEGVVRFLGRQATAVDTAVGLEVAEAVGETPPVSDLARTWERTNRRLHRDLSSKYYQDVLAVFAAAPRGVRAESLIKRLQRRAQVTRSAARRVAVDQTLTLYAESTRDKHKALGIDSYVWISSRDARTRSHHRRLDGQTFLYSDPPVGGGTRPGDRGHPGDGILCRCTARPILG
jgi:SPP1 gp7 family putative phage head morphogenesis protein